MGDSSLARNGQPSYANIVSTGSYLPEIEVTNDMLRKGFDASVPDFVNKMEASSGIKSRWQAIERAGKNPRLSLASRRPSPAGEGRRRHVFVPVSNA